MRFLKLKYGPKMTSENLLNRITANPDVMVGKPTIRGLRITVEQILTALANGITTQELLKDYPELEKEDIQAVLLYASKIVGEERVFKISVQTNNSIFVSNSL